MLKNNGDKNIKRKGGKRREEGEKQGRKRRKRNIY